MCLLEFADGDELRAVLGVEHAGDGFVMLVRGIHFKIGEFQQTAERLALDLLHAGEGNAEGFRFFADDVK